MEQPTTPQPTTPQPPPLRGGREPSKAGRYIVVALIAAALAALGTYVAYAKYAEENLYTEAEALEIVNGVAKAVSQRAYDLGKQQKCDRNI